MTSFAAPSATAKRPPCPVCGREGTVSLRPFCSRRCADVDLGRWLTGAYAIPGAPGPPSDSETGAEPAR